VVILRFSTVEKLSIWAQSEERRKLLNEGRAYFDSPPTLEVLVGKPKPRDVLTSVASHEVLPGKEQDFKQWQDKLTKAQEKFPGFMGGELFQPVEGVQENWVSLFRYDTAVHLAEWLESDTRAELLREGSRYMRSFDLHTVNSPFSGWFGFGGGQSATIPSWKQAMAVLLALFPIVVVLAYLLRILRLSGSLFIFVGLALSTVILTWVLIPLVNRALGFWLVPHEKHPARTDLVGAGVVVLCYAVLVALAVLAFG
jgi:antibiotic biosynthesis monooxygenase (ABM) superfamily enzyme